MPDIVRIDGLQQLGRALRELSDGTANRVCGQATGAAARIVRDGVKAIIRANVDPETSSGSLEESVIIKKLPKSQLDGLTAAHIVTPRHRRSKRKTKGKQAVAPHAVFVQFGTVNMPAEPFLDVGLIRNRSRAEQAMKDKLTQGIAREAKRVGK